VETRRLGSAREIASMDAIDGRVAIEACCLNPERRRMMRARQTILCGLAGSLVLLGIACSSDQSEVEHPITVPQAGPVVTAPVTLRNIPPGSTPAGAAGSCTQDADCPSRFCDRGLCAKPIGEENYGNECKPSTPYALLPPRPPPPPGTIWPLIRDAPSECGAYLCVEERCRSCQSDDECGYWLGRAFCAPGSHFGGQVDGGDYPGKLCLGR
jgi:hypothetical protein